RNMTKTKLKIYLKLSRILFISIFLVNATDVDCQTVKYEDVFISHYFYTFINNIKEHCKPVFNEKESAILSKIKVVLDSSSEETYIANS
ncbi:hypothetical protein ACE4ZV_26595, partial [Salmonella enterica]|uniref:hypothetical protein n=1 Tax=Salmonella enterica TaxID=28901 RepID=UPI003D2D3D9A